MLFIFFLYHDYLSFILRFFIFLLHFSRQLKKFLSIILSYHSFLPFVVCHIVIELPPPLKHFSTIGKIPQNP